MKTILFLSLVFLTLTQSSTTSTAAEVKDFILGFMIGLRATTYVPSGYDCVMALENWQTVIPQLEKDFESISIENILNAVNLIESTLNSTITPCKQAGIEGEAYFKNITDTIKSPNFVKQASIALLEHFEAVTKDAETIKTAFSSKDLVSAGLGIGDILAIAIWNTTQ